MTRTALAVLALGVSVAAAPAVAAPVLTPMEREAGPPHVPFPELLNRPPSIYAEFGGAECIVYLGDDLKTGKGVEPLPMCAEVPASLCAIYGPWHCHYPLPADTWALLSGDHRVLPRAAAVATAAASSGSRSNSISGARSGGVVIGGGGGGGGGDTHEGDVIVVSEEHHHYPGCPCGCCEVPEVPETPETPVTPAPIPLPASWMFLTTGLGALALSRRKLGEKFRRGLVGLIDRVAPPCRHCDGEGCDSCNFSGGES